MARTKGKSRGKRKTRKIRKSKVRSHQYGGYAAQAPMVGTFGQTFKSQLGTTLGTMGAVKAIDTVAGLFQKKNSRPKPKAPKAPILKSYDSGSGRFTYS